MSPNFPFTEANLLKGLRQYLVTPQVQLRDLRLGSGPAVIPGNYGDTAGLYQQTPLVAELQVEGKARTMGLTWHQAPPATIEREYGFYTQLADNVMGVLIVGFITGDPGQGWLVLEGLDNLLAPEDWSPNDYREAMQHLSKLHFFGWNNTANLEMFDFLWEPLGRDWDAVYTGIVKPASYELIHHKPHPLLDSPHYLTLFGLLDAYFQDFSNRLREQTPSLLHGSYWPGNIARQLDGGQIMTHWQYVSLGPPVLDLVMFHQSTLSHLPQAQMPPDAAVNLYREYFEERLGDNPWTQKAWDESWDYALLWLFAVHWLARLARMNPADYGAIHARMARVWYGPMAKALLRRFQIQLPPP